MTGPRMALFDRTGILPMEAATVWAAVLDYLDGYVWGKLEVITPEAATVWSAVLDYLDNWTVDIIDANAAPTELYRYVCSNRLTWDGWTGRANRYAGPPSLPPQKKRGRGFTKPPHKRNPR